jgi:hypothetical protein
MLADAERETRVAGIAATPSLTDRMLRAAKLDKSLYNEVEADTSATPQALTVVVIVAIASGIGFAIGGAMGRAGAGSIVGGLIAGVLLALVGWAVVAFFTYWVGTRFFGGTATYGELLRTLGYATTPGVLNILAFIPVLGGLILFVTWIWTLVCEYVAIREALDLDNGRTIATIIVAIIAYAVVAIVITAVLAAIGLGAGVLSGRM